MLILLLQMMQFQDFIAFNTFLEEDRNASNSTIDWKMSTLEKKMIKLKFC